MRSATKRSDAENMAKCENGKTYYWCHYYCQNRVTGDCKFVRKKIAHNQSSAQGDKK